MGSSRFLEAVKAISDQYPDRCAYFNSRGEGITYGELWRDSDALALWLSGNSSNSRPVVVYGHKSPLMLVSLFAAVKAGKPYVPVDVAYPADRVNDILEQTHRPLLIDVSDNGFLGDCALAERVLPRGEIAPIISSGGCLTEQTWLAPEDTFYLLFTSGSTGRPKGVQMSSAAVDAFMDYFKKFFSAFAGEVSFNRVPCTFDVSLFDIIGGLSSGCTLFALEAERETSMAAAFEALGESGLSIWISTPSYIESCLVDPSFGPELLPSLKEVVLCGEILRNSTAQSILDRFPGVMLYNTYGPTETQAVTDLLVTQDVVTTLNPLPVGYFGPNNAALICDMETGELLSEGKVGEVYLTGPTLSKGYYGRPELTEKMFSVPAGRTDIAYRTGDKGYIDAEGRLYCLGRLDFQVKLNGFRIELGDVEQGLVSLDLVKEAVVLPVEKEGRVSHLAGHVVLASEDEARDFQTALAIKAQLAEILPAYMIPRKIVFHDTFPLNNNGKIDRKRIAAR